MMLRGKRLYVWFGISNAGSDPMRNCDVYRTLAACVSEGPRLFESGFENPSAAVM
jgi:hypothetical protein